MSDANRLHITVGVDGCLHARIIAAIAKADQDWCSDNPLYEDMADAVIAELGLEVSVTAKSSDGRFRSVSIEGYWEEQ